MDTLQHHYDTSIFKKLGDKYYDFGAQFWDPRISWVNKYITNNDGILEYKPKFFGSTTFLVFLTDGWHLMKEIMLSSMCISFGFISEYNTFLLFVITRFSIGIVFHIFYTYIFNKK